MLKGQQHCLQSWEVNRSVSWNVFWLHYSQVMLLQEKPILKQRRTPGRRNASCPHLHIKPFMNKNDLAPGMKFLTDHCTATHNCSLSCTAVCPTAAIRPINKSNVLLHKRQCIQCGKCASVCPKNVIQQNKDGYIFFREV